MNRSSHSGKSATAIYLPASGAILKSRVLQQIIPSPGGNSYQRVSHDHSDDNNTFEARGL